jgi:(p)ppGpp synthase/HD superfamily hydrolase
MSVNYKVLIQEAKEYVHAGHDSIGEKRKYGENVPYWRHVDWVERIVHLVTNNPNMRIAALAHDLIESVDKPPYDIVTIAQKFGGEVAMLVRELTDVYVAKNFPRWNRAERKKYEAIRLGFVSNDAKTIKLADLIHNTFSIVFYDLDFAKTYLQEKRNLLPRLIGGNKILWWTAKIQLEVFTLYLKIRRIFVKN